MTSNYVQTAPVAIAADLAPSKPGTAKGPAASLSRARAVASNWQPAVEIQETSAFIYVQLQLPGFERDEIEVQAFETAIVVRGGHFSSYGSSRGCVLSSEFCYGSFERIVQLPQAIVVAQVQAELRDGLLTVSLAKH